MLGKEEFMALSGNEKLWITYQAACLAKPRAPMPKRDGRQGKKGDVFNWYSEMMLHDLEYWLGRNEKESRERGKYADKAAEKAQLLAEWVKWRTVEPDTRWVGVRGKKGSEPVEAHLPSERPMDYSWKDPEPAPRQSSSGGRGFADADEAPPYDDEEPPPF